MWRFNKEAEEQAAAEEQTQEDLEWAEILRIHEEAEQKRIAEERAEIESLYNALTLAAKYVEAAKIDYANNPDVGWVAKNLIDRLNEYEAAHAEWEKTVKE